MELSLLQISLKHSNNHCPSLRALGYITNIWDSIPLSVFAFCSLLCIFCIRLHGKTMEGKRLCYSLSNRSNQSHQHQVPLQYHIINTRTVTLIDWPATVVLMSHKNLPSFPSWKSPNAFWQHSSRFHIFRNSEGHYMFRTFSQLPSPQHSFTSCDMIPWLKTQSVHIDRNLHPTLLYAHNYILLLVLKIRPHYCWSR